MRRTNITEYEDLWLHGAIGFLPNPSQEKIDTDSVFTESLLTSNCQFASWILSLISGGGGFQSRVICDVTDMRSVGNMLNEETQVLLRRRHQVKLCWVVREVMGLALACADRRSLTEHFSIAVRCVSPTAALVEDDMLR